MPPKNEEERFSVDQLMTPREFMDFVGDVRRVVKFIDKLEAIDVQNLAKLVSDHEVILRGREDKPGLLTRIDRTERIISIIVWVVTIVAGLLITGGISLAGFLLTHGGTVFTFPGVTK